MRNVTIDCDSCGTRMPIEQGKEVLIKEGTNDYHLIDLCAKCLDTQLQNAESVNDSNGYRQQVAALVTPKGDQGSERSAS